VAVLGWNWHNKVSGEDLIILNTGSPDDDEQAAKLAVGAKGGAAGVGSWVWWSQVQLHTANAGLV
jgi:hypothetical protein